MTLLSILSFTSAILIVVVSILRRADLFSPGKVFGLIWLVSIGLTELKLSRLQHEWNDFSWIVLMIGILSFYVGVFIVYVINYKRRAYRLGELRNFFNHSLFDENKLFNSGVILYFVYVVSFLGNYLIEGYLPIFHVNPGQSRAFWGVFGIGLTIHAATTLILIAVQYVTLASAQKIKKMISVFIVISTFLTYIFILQRFNLMFAIIAVIVFLYYSSHLLKPRNAILTFIIMVGLMYSVQFFRMSSFALSYLYNLAEMKFSFKYAIFTEPYMYVVMNLENFVKAAEKLQDHTFGYYTFNFMLSITGLKHPLNDYWPLNNFPFLTSSSYNTYSMFWDYFRDFGVWGLSLIPAIMGFGISIVYYRLRSNPTLINISLYSIFVFIMFISFFVNVIGLLHFIFNTGLILFISYYVSKTDTSGVKSLDLEARTDSVGGIHD